MASKKPLLIAEDEDGDLFLTDGRVYDGTSEGRRRGVALDDCPRRRRPMPDSTCPRCNRLPAPAPHSCDEPEPCDEMVTYTVREGGLCSASCGCTVEGAEDLAGLYCACDPPPEDDALAPPAPAEES